VDGRSSETLKDKRLGAILGAAIGDAMGHPTEFMSLDSIRRAYPPDGVKGFELWWTDEATGRKFAPYTDDTQMAEVVLRSILSCRRLDMDADSMMGVMAGGFVEWSRNPQGGHRAPGGACMSGCHALASGVDWKVSGGQTAGGCGSVMRAYPFGLFYEMEEAGRLATLHSRMTHRDPIALAACAAMGVGVAMLLNGYAVLETADMMMLAANEQDAKTGQMIRQAIAWAGEGVHPDIVLNKFRGWAAHEAIAAAVYLLVRNPDDARQAILEGANSEGDSDSLATLAGALLGARLGLQALPPEWVRDVERSDVFLRILDEP
jgi:ADP-ribosylglycohydrolase